METLESTAYLQSLLNCTLRIQASDTRIFVGEFKCTDSECNIILARTHEYRHPSPSAVNAAANSALTNASATEQDPGQDSLKVNMTSRFLGLVVVPGQHIMKIEVEEKVQEGQQTARLRKEVKGVV